MIGCANCGTLNRKGSKYCSYCGERLTEGQVVCSTCGRPNAADSAYCVYCSSALKSPSGIGAPEPALPDMEEEPIAERPRVSSQLPAWLYTPPVAEPVTPPPLPCKPLPSAEPLETGRTKYLQGIEGVLPSAESWLALSEKRVSNPSEPNHTTPEEPPTRKSSKTARRSGCLALPAILLALLCGLIAIR